MRRIAIVLALVVTTSGCVSPELFRATVKAGTRDVVVATAVVAVVAHAARYAIEKSFARRARATRPCPTDAEQSVDNRWAEARRRR
jgi:hypothetical protein